MQAVLNAVWQHLLPALGPVPLAENPTAQARLADKLSGLALAAPQGQALTGAGAAISGKTFRLEPNSLKIEAVRFDFGASGTALKLRFPDGPQAIDAGCGAWIEGALGPRRVAASGVWTAADTFLLTLRYYETPFYDTYTFQFDGDRLLLKGSVNVAFGQKEYPAVQGRVEV